MTTYHLSIHKRCSSYSGMETYSSKELQLDNKQDFVRAKQLCENKKNMAGFWKQTVLPIRTDRASDLFCPILMNLVIKTKKFSESTFTVIGAIIWDLATLPVRCVTFLPRMAYNAMITPEEHPLISYLQEKGLSSLDVKDRVNVLVYKKEIKEEEDCRFEKKCGKEYALYLTDREIAFPYKKSLIFSMHSLDGKPLPILKKWLFEIYNTTALVAS